LLKSEDNLKTKTKHKIVYSVWGKYL